MFLRKFRVPLIWIIQNSFVFWTIPNIFCRIMLEVTYLNMDVNSFLPICRDHHVNLDSETRNYFYGVFFFRFDDFTVEYLDTVTKLSIFDIKVKQYTVIFFKLINKRPLISFILMRTMLSCSMITGFTSCQVGLFIS